MNLEYQFITYKELNHKSNQLAYLLREKGVQADMPRLLPKLTPQSPLHDHPASAVGKHHFQMGGIEAEQDALLLLEGTQVKGQQVHQQLG